MWDEFMSDDEPFPDDGSSDEYLPGSELESSDSENENGLSEYEPLQKKKKVVQKGKTSDSRTRAVAIQPDLAGPSQSRGK